MSAFGAGLGAVVGDHLPELEAPTADGGWGDDYDQSTDTQGSQTEDNEPRPLLRVSTDTDDMHGSVIEPLYGGLDFLEVGYGVIESEDEVEQFDRFEVDRAESQVSVPFDTLEVSEETRILAAVEVEYADGETETRMTYFEAGRNPREASRDGIRPVMEFQFEEELTEENLEDYLPELLDPEIREEDPAIYLEFTY